MDDSHAIYIRIMLIHGIHSVPNACAKYEVVSSFYCLHISDILLYYFLFFTVSFFFSFTAAIIGYLTCVLEAYYDNDDVLRIECL